MRVVIVKQANDVFGPWRPITWARETPLSVLRSFVYKATLWEMTAALQADWYIVPASSPSAYSKYLTSFPRLGRLMEQFQGEICDPAAIDFDAYDIAITLEACLSAATIARHPGTHFFYLMHEHSNSVYNKQRRNPLPFYAGFLDHMCGETGEQPVDPRRVIEMPYLRAPEIVRQCFPRQPRNGKPRVWLEARTVVGEATGNPNGVWTSACDALVHEMQQSVSAELLFRSTIYTDFYNVQHPNTLDALRYYRELANADYFVGLAAAGAGQSLCDAASAGSVCFGSPQLVYHRLLCPPESLVGSLREALEKVVALDAEPQEAARRRAFQDDRLRTTMQEEPVRRLYEACRVTRLRGPMRPCPVYVRRKGG